MCIFTNKFNLIEHELHPNLELLMLILYVTRMYVVKWKTTVSAELRTPRTTSWESEK